MAYATALQLKEYLGIKEDADDLLLDGIIARSQAIIEAYTGRVFEAATATKYFDEEYIEGQDLDLWGEDLLSVTKLTNGNGVEIVTNDYRLFPRNGLPKWRIRLDYSRSWEFSTDESEISIAGTWGYSAIAPANIQHACIRLAAFIYRQKDTSADIDRPMITGDGVTIMPSGLPADVQALLNPYKRRIA